MLVIILSGNPYYTSLRPVFKMADSTSVVAVAVCCDTGSMHSASLYCRFILTLFKEFGGIVFLQLTFTHHT